MSCAESRAALAKAGDIRQRRFLSMGVTQYALAYYLSLTMNLGHVELLQNQIQKETSFPTLLPPAT